MKTEKTASITASLAMDDLIASSGVAYRALANPSFFENLLEEADSIREKGVFTDVVDADRKAASPSSDRRTCPPTTWPAS